MNMPSPISQPQWPSRPVYIPTQKDLDDTELVYLLRDVEVGAEVLRRKLIELKQTGGQNENRN